MTLCWNRLKFSLPAIFMSLSMLLPQSANSLQLEPYRVDQAQFSLPGLDGNTHALSDYRGKVVLVNFWASWCTPCVEEMPELSQLKQQLAGRPFEILAINAGESKYKVGQFVKLINFNLPVLLDPSTKVFNNWGIKILPTSFLLDTEGRIRYRARGYTGWEHDQTVSIINKLIAETAKPEDP